MPLTEEQRQRMEANRLKALEIRQKKSEKSSSPLSDEQRRKIADNRQKALEKRRQNSHDVPSVSKKAFYGRPTPNNSASPSAVRLAGKCVLGDGGRFVVDLRYHEGSIAVFKSVGSGQYDAKQRSWSFDVRDHDELLRRLKSKAPDIRVDPLPKWAAVPAVASANASADQLWAGIEPALRDALMPFQVEGVKFSLKINGRVLIADDMGLGKTIQALAVASAYRCDWPLLIVCPSSMRFAWKSAVVRWLPSVPEEDIGVVLAGRDTVADFTIVIISYDLLAKKQDDLLNNLGARVVILDESHFIKSYKTARAKSADAICKEASRTILLSGTPALSRPIELYPQISIVSPKLFGCVTDFGMRYCDGKKIQLGPNNHRYDFLGSSNMEELSLVMKQRFMLRRMKSDVLSQLPAKQRQMVVLDPTQVRSKSKSMQAHAFQMGSRDLSRGERRGVLLQWFHSTAEAKSPAVQDYMRDLIEGGKKFICFAHHNTMMNDIGRTLDKAKVGHVRVDGSTNSAARKEAVDAFQTDDSVRVALLSITAANSGLTLTAAQLVVFAELFWNPGVLTQAEDRAHRIGQTDCVTVQYLVATGTADDELWPMIQQKLDVLSKAGLTKDDFRDSESKHHQTGSCATGDKITDHFDFVLTEEDMEAFEEDWNPEIEEK